ncbi:MAG: hypothetical protein H7332_16600 [Bdellovibrionales bacterium]|nr:hypothetical protein [Ramlibacter sp.]
MVIKLADADAVIARQKVVVRDMAWQAKLNSTETGWFEARMPLRFIEDEEVPEQLFAVVQWKKGDKAIPEQWTFGVIYQGERIIAYDIQPLGGHVNHKGKGRPHYQQPVDGVHVHTYSADGSGYAEPLNVPDNVEVIWAMFCKRAGIVRSDFIDPNSGQQELEI